MWIESILCLLNNTENLCVQIERINSALFMSSRDHKSGESSYAHADIGVAGQGTGAGAAFSEISDDKPDQPAYEYSCKYFHHLPPGIILKMLSV